MSDYEFLAWLYDRLVLVYHESPNMDFVQRLRRLVDTLAPKPCGDQIGITGLFVCNEPEGHDGDHHMTGMSARVVIEALKDEIEALREANSELTCANTDLNRELTSLRQAMVDGRDREGCE